jgi:hypothetical protein
MASCVMGLRCWRSRKLSQPVLGASARKRRLPVDCFSEQKGISPLLRRLVVDFPSGGFSQSHILLRRFLPTPQLRRHLLHVGSGFPGSENALLPTARHGRPLPFFDSQLHFGCQDILRGRKRRQLFNVQVSSNFVNHFGIDGSLPHSAGDGKCIKAEIVNISRNALTGFGQLFV